MGRMIDVSPGEEQVIKILKSLKPFESIIIRADRDGKPDTYFMERTSKGVISGFAITFVK